MKNVYTIRNEKKFYFILSSKISEKIGDSYSVGIFVNLYYEETVDWYFNRLADIAISFPVYIISSRQNILHKAKSKGFFTIHKENRGRDLSALLIAARDKIRCYEYVCFAHDKKSLYIDNSKLLEDWKLCLWNSVLNNVTYVKNVINTFLKNPLIGLLLPPECPSSVDWSAYGKGLWDIEYPNSVKLISDFNLNCNIDIKYPPISIGTVFWCRRKAMNILFDHDWQYSDFSEEPMPNSGTISHSLERSLSFFAQSEGFETGTIMTEDEAVNRIMLYTETMHNLFPIFGEMLQGNSINDLSQKCEILKKYKELFKNNSNVYLFGAGKIGKTILYKLLALNFKPKGIIVTEKKENPSEIAEIPVYSLQEISDKNIKIIVGVGKKLKDEVIAVLQSKFNKKDVLYYTEL